MFIELLTHFNTPLPKAEDLWQELQRAYAQRGRHYHSMAHIEHMLAGALAHRAAVHDWSAFLLAIYYHDAVYNVLKKDNEEKSAALAQKRLKHTEIAPETLETCIKHILATKHHEPSENPDTNLLLDLDLAILGGPWETYEQYARQVRKEYGIYPDLLYNPGRKKVLATFLERAAIYKTPTYQAAHEAQARENIAKEITLL
jgi:predicted metal-dependent HD superfamily phosphohydrolase